MTMKMRTETNPWDAIASGYDTYVTPTHLELAEAALDHAGLQAGERLLDVACGSGAVSLPAARRGARVVAVDLSEAMVARLQARADAEGLDVEARVMDGHALDLDDDTFDVAASQFGLMLFPDLRRGLAEMVRVTRPGGRVVVNAFGPPQRVEFLMTFLGAIRSVVPGFTGLPTDPPPLPFQVADPAKLRRELVDAGLQDVRIHEVPERLRFDSGQAMWHWVVHSNPIAQMLIADLDERQRRAVRDALDAVVRQRAGDDGVAAFTSLVHVAIGTKGEA